MVYGPPGAGKGTQANMLSWSKNFIHFDTGKFLEEIVHDPSKQKNKTIARERKNFDSGRLVTPSFVLKLTREKATEIGKAGFNIVFSGSPRTVFEALGDSRNKGLIETLEKTYGKKNIYPIFLKIDPQKAIKRNKKRLVCTSCGNAMLAIDPRQQLKACTLCGGKLKKRTVDNPAVFKTRIAEYKERTLPIMAELKKRGYKIINIDGMPLPYEVHRKILKKLPL